MNTISEFATSPAWQFLAEALLHSLWQGALLSLLLFCALSMIPVRFPGARYVSALAVMIALVCSVAFTWQWLRIQEAVEPAAPVSAAESSVGQNTFSTVTTPSEKQVSAIQETATFNATPQTPGPALIQREDWLQWVTLFWGMGVIVMLGRMAWMVGEAGNVRRRCRPVTDSRILELIEGTAKKLGIRRRIAAKLGEHVSMIAVAGVIQPCVLFPASLLTGQSMEHLRAVIAHELAHIRRQDYFVNLAQLVVESLLFFNPFVWWISRQIRTERESCCDALAVKITGEPTRYSKALAEVAVRILDARKGVGVMQAFGDESKASTLRGRIERLLLPHRQPRLSWSWLGAGIGLSITAIALAILWYGSMSVAQVVARALTDEERVEQIAEVNEEYGVQPAIESEPRRIQITGKIVTEDGGPLPGAGGNSHVVGFSRNSTGGGTTSNMGYNTNGVINHHLPDGKIHLLAWVEGYAPTLLGPFYPSADKNLENLELVLKRGFSAQIQFVDPEGNAIPGVSVKSSYPVEGSSMGIDEDIADENGVFKIEHGTSDIDIQIRAAVSGFEPERSLRFTLSPGTNIVQTLHPAKIVTGRLVSAATGGPVEGATITPIYEKESRFSSRGFGFENDDVVAISDQNGRFELNQLKQGVSSFFLVRAEGYRPEWLKNITTESGPLEVTMREPLVVAGRLIGSIDELDRNWRTKAPYFQYNVILEDENNDRLYNDFIDAGVSPTPEGGTFSITNLWEGPIEIHAGNQRIELNVTESIDDLVINLDEEVPTFPPREVVFKFLTPEGAPSPSGVFRARTMYNLPEKSYGMPDEIPIQNGEARIEVLTPSSVMLEPGGMIGYMPKELENYGSRTIEIPEGEGSYEIEVPVVPAGSIFGEIDPPAGGGDLHIHFRESQPGLIRTSNLSDITNYATRSDRFEREGRFNLTPLPLGAEYHLVFRRGNTIVQSEKIELTPENPLRQVRLTLPDETETVSGTVVAPDGTPIAGQPVHPSYVSTFESSYGHQGGTTDREGNFRIDGLNPNLPGPQRLSLYFETDYQPVSIELEFDGNPIDIKLKQGVTLHGQVVDYATGAPISDLNIVAGAVGIPGTSRTRTDEGGNFRFSNLDHAEYRFYVGGEGEIVGRRSALSGQSEPVILRVTDRER